ncbi:hypothetical protein EV421DRAFT_1736140 [Armillaria borealis]|uniref:Uncharacterized protein n=1 Tax=Armillaria borealis TaxID=47425 RepID=A0AA39JH12_9AGAR|nr:hypothetical protein EV421DRAFT_1736140 [Armillaria borealis]
MYNLAEADRKTSKYDEYDHPSESDHLVIEPFMAANLGPVTHEDDLDGPEFGDSQAVRKSEIRTQNEDDQIRRWRERESLSATTYEVVTRRKRGRTHSCYYFRREIAKTQGYPEDTLRNGPTRSKSTGRQKTIEELYDLEFTDRSGPDAEDSGSEEWRTVYNPSLYSPLDVPSTCTSRAKVKGCGDRMVANTKVAWKLRFRIERHMTVHPTKRMALYTFGNPDIAVYCIVYHWAFGIETRWMDDTVRRARQRRSTKLGPGHREENSRSTELGLTQDTPSVLLGDGGRR